MFIGSNSLNCNLPADWDIGGWFGFMRHVSALEECKRVCGASGHWQVANDNDAAEAVPFRGLLAFDRARKVPVARLPQFSIHHIASLSHEGPAS